MAVIFGRTVFKRRSVPQHSCSDLQLVNLIVEGRFDTDHKDRRCKSVKSEGWAIKMIHPNIAIFITSI